MIGEIIAIGDELTSGRILNSTSNFAAHQLFAMGHEVAAMATIGDSPKLIGKALLEALSRADFVLVTGGLGPTSDDLTNEAVANALGRPSTFHPEVLQQIQEYLEQQKKNGSTPPSISLEKLAWLPAGAEVLKPGKSMAGYLLVHQDKPIFFLPGVPHEMKELLVDCVIPRLAQWKGQALRKVRQQTYKIYGLSEAEVNRRLHYLEEENSFVRLGYYPVFPEVHLSLTVLGENDEDTGALFHVFDQRILDNVGNYVFGYDDASMGSVVGALMKNQGLTLGIAESCTGGLISHQLTTFAGSSEYFRGGVVAYSNGLKMDLLGVGEQTLIDHGAVSAETAREMAVGVRERAKTDFGVSVTGIAGPSGGSEEKPVGTVYFGLACGNGQTYDLHRLFKGNRGEVQTQAAMTALDFVRRKLLE